jgi:hypothetical protein
MINAKDEFLDHVHGTKALVKAAHVTRGDDYWEEAGLTVDLRVKYTLVDYQRFLQALDFSYDSGYGGQELYGTIWYTDGTWSSRGEYDGSEWWEYNKCPEILEELIL